MNHLPEDPILLFSVVNTKLRDEYPSLQDLCRSLDVNEEKLVARLAAAGFEYREENNQFR